MANRSISITQTFLKECVHYDPIKGSFRWRRRPLRHFVDGKYPATTICASWNKKFQGAFAGGRDFKGYINIKINGVLYKAHRLAWLYMTGKWPIAQIDHKDGDKKNNAWANLREATNGQNQMNLPVKRNNTSGVKGVSWDKNTRRWRARITAGGVCFTIGYFREKKDAAAAYTAAAQNRHGEFRFSP